ncbi:hypothetical protein [Streptosporangium roseum]|uniref:hypothetical protein n=1 Tax=Streptosporangium roseum TaxID=2001 RepID=UPI0001A3D8FF|nr:hypothetical protein [Streptosporangium roseum]
MTTQTWIITGASRGFGRALAESALAAGDHVVAAEAAGPTGASQEIDHPSRLR